eukprot:m.19070 g.19070  ORF g.19070 m.19070 type:complete len:610 (-) comp10892_c0_seq1:19-1848(-)
MVMQAHATSSFRQMSEVGLYLHKSFWAYPFLSVVFNIMLSYALCSIDIDPSRYNDLQTVDLSVYVIIFTGSVDGARALASMLSATAISVVTLTFSLTVLSLQIAASNYSPRILDEFIKDRVTKWTLSVFLGTFAYCFVVQWSLRTETDDIPAYVPIVAVNMLMPYLVINLATFVFFLHHFIVNMQLEHILGKASLNAVRVARTTLPEAIPVSEWPSDWTDEHNNYIESLPEVPPRAYRLRALKSGYVCRWHHETILHIATKRDLVFRYQCHVGHFVTKGTLLCWVWFVNDRSKADEWEIEDRSGKDLVTYLTDLANSGLIIGSSRTGDDDVGFGIRQLTDVAVRALSPGVNDPHSAIQAIDAMTSVFVELAQRHMGNVTAPDEDGVVRVCASGIQFVHVLAVCMDQIRAYGKEDVTVARRCLFFLGDIGSICQTYGFTQRVRAIRAQIAQWEAAHEQTFHKGEKSSHSWFESAKEYAQQVISSATAERAYEAMEEVDHPRPEDGASPSKREEQSAVPRRLESAPPRLANRTLETLNPGDELQAPTPTLLNDSAPLGHLAHGLRRTESERVKDPLRDDARLSHSLPGSQESLNRSQEPTQNQPTLITSML